MKKVILYIVLSICTITANAQFPAPAGQTGTTAIHKDSSAFVAWATACTIVRGYQDISNPTLGYASYGDSTAALGIANGSNVVSLGDGGYAILRFDKPIKDSTGWDFAVFENSYSDAYLELAFVEVSSDGINYFRFPATSYTQDSLQIGGFSNLDARNIDNLAGKYRGLYGTPFDLQQLSTQIGLDINAITHIKIIDVVGCIQSAYSTYDQYGNKINDPWNTPFVSSGFDLDAIGVIHNNNAVSINNTIANTEIKMFPNPVKSGETLNFSLPIDNYNTFNVSLYDFTGRQVYSQTTSSQISNIQIPQHLQTGIYILKIKTSKYSFSKRVVIE